MGSNESLPPPPPPGQPPYVPPSPPAPTAPVPPPPAPPAPPVFTPAPAPPQQYPPTQAYPTTPGGPPVGGPPPGGVPPAPPTGPGPGPRKKNWALIGGGVAALIAIVVAVIVLTGGDDKSTTLGGDVTEPTTATSSDVTEVTEAPTSAPDDTLVITAPPTTIPPPTLTPTTDGTVPDIRVTDDTNAFSVLMPGDWATDTGPVDANGVQFAQISGSGDLGAYNNDHDTLGITLLGIQADLVSAPADLLSVFDPGVDVCSQRQTASAVDTLQGPAEVLYLDGCGTGGAFGKVVMIVSFPANNAVLITISQGNSPSTGRLFNFTKIVVESVQAL